MDPAAFPERPQEAVKPQTHLTRLASDHLPLLAELALPGPDHRPVPPPRDEAEAEAAPRPDGEDGARGPHGASAPRGRMALRPESPEP